MSRKRTSIKNPDEDPNLEAFDLIRRFTGGETPAEKIARVEKEHRNPDVRILERLQGKRRGGLSRPPKA